MFNLPAETIKKVEKRNSNFYKILKNSLKIKDEEILIITDEGVGSNTLSTMLGYGYHYATRKKKLNTSVLIQDVKKGFMQADETVLRAIENLKPGSVIIIAVSNKIGRFGEAKSFRALCREKKHRFISAIGLADVQPIHFDLFLEAMNINYKRMRKKASVIKKAWDNAKVIRVTTPAGTDITFEVEGMNAVTNIGEYHELGSGGNMPAGEVYIAPKGETGVNGIFVIDGSMKTDSGARLVEEPIKVSVEKGMVTKVEGKQAHLLEKTFEKFEDRAKYPDRIRMICELGIGINPGAVLIGSTIMDEKVLGTAHIAFGSNYWFGGDIKTIFHGDQVFKNPTFYVDGKKMDV